ncbi:hypothetical protein Zmor_004340 [Zophobas morio]|uniref:Myosin motor domain-containing protein n=1 Tax=Zophobas morio TaxID=2755281 RepID=A0AA38HKK8_9CUCU|nr:hypothetical protein Zmor_004340 [Zophobas morio]
MSSNVLLEDDLCKLQPLNETAVFNCIKNRFNKGLIYTYSGPALIGVNPMRPIAIYGKDFIERYNRSQNVRELPPHVYAVAEQAYQILVNQQRSASIIVSGESGSGKTVSCRYLLEYFASVIPFSHHEILGKSVIEQHLLSTGLILESFGNASTLRNANSSRFGKYIRVQLDESLKICGARVDTYLLEKTRVIAHAFGEKTFHIFYQLCAGGTQEQRSRYFLTGLTRENFYYTVRDQYRYRCEFSSSLSLHEKTIEDEESDFENTISALRALNVGEDLQEDLFRILAGILYLGQIFPEEKFGKSFVVTGPGSRFFKLLFFEINTVSKAAELLGVAPAHLAKLLQNKKIVAFRDTIYSPITRRESEQLRDCLSKDIYKRLFDWLVYRINSLFSENEIFTIGILDIYGFEKFEENSLEQLCINYANEKLQQLFVSVVFKVEQQVYFEEGIDWSFIKYADNHECIEMMEGSPGVFSLLSEQCFLNRTCSDEKAFTERLYNTFKANPYFLGEKSGASSRLFTIRHYAMDVSYSTAQFMEKNMDHLGFEYVELMRSSRYEFVRNLFLENSLTTLIDALSKTESHFVRCLKPNACQSGVFVNEERKRKVIDKNNSKFTLFDGAMVLQQLHASGIVDAVRIAQASYPYKYMYSDFIKKYSILIGPSDPRATLRETVEAALSRLFSPLCTDVQFGRTMVFLRTQKISSLDLLISEKREFSSTCIQSFLRFFLRKESKKVILLLIKLYIVRLILFPNIYKKNLVRACVQLQTFFRGLLARGNYKAVTGTLAVCQTCASSTAAAPVKDYNKICESLSEARPISIHEEKLYDDVLHLVTDGLPDSKFESHGSSALKYFAERDQAGSTRIVFQGQSVVVTVTSSASSPHTLYLNLCGLAKEDFHKVNVVLTNQPTSEFLNSFLISSQIKMISKSLKAHQQSSFGSKVCDSLSSEDEDPAALDKLDDYNSLNISESWNWTPSKLLPSGKFWIIEDYNTQKKTQQRPLNYYRYSAKSAEQLDKEIEYDVDDEDLAWLAEVNVQREREGLGKVTPQMFEYAIDRLEKG